MQMTKALGSFLAAGAALVALSFAGDARADDSAKVEGGNGEVKVTAPNGYHVNKEYPWKINGTKTTPTFDGEKVARLKASAGSVEVKGAICGGPNNNCVPFTQTVTVK